MSYSARSTSAISRRLTGRVAIQIAAAAIARIKRKHPAQMLAFTPFAPSTRLSSKRPPAIAPASEDYCAAVRDHYLVDAWYRAAADEPDAWLIPRYENP